MNGAEGWFILDSGSEVMVLDRAFADSLALAGGPPFERGLAFRGPSRPARVPSRHAGRKPAAVRRLPGEARFEVEVAGVPVPSVDVRFRLPGTEAARSESTSFDGAMGPHLLRHFTLVLDFANQRVSLIQGGGDRE